MEMEFKDPDRRRRILLIVVGVVLAGAAGWGAFMLANGKSAAAPVVTDSVLVAARDIPARQQVTADDVKVSQVNVDEILTQSYKEPDLVVGRLTAVPVYADQQITPNLFATSAADTDFSILGPDEEVTLDSPFWRAVAIQIPNDRAVGGEVKAGQHVDLVVSVDIRILMQAPDGTVGECDAAVLSQVQCGKSTKLTFQDVEVLKASPDDEMYVFKMDLHQAEQVSHVIQEAPDSFTMVLRPETDTRVADSTQYGTTTDRLVMTYLYPVPQLIDVLQLLNPPLPNGSPAPGATPIPGVPGPGETPGASPEPGSSPAPETSPEPQATPVP